MKLITESYYRKSKLIFFAGLLWFVTVPSCVMLWKKSKAESMTDGVVRDLHRMNERNERISDIPRVERASITKNSPL